MKKIALLMFGLAGLIGCSATNQVKFDYWRGLPADAASGLARGNFAYSKDAVFKAAQEVFDHEPFLHWEYLNQDSKEGWIKVSAGQFRLCNLQVTDAAGNSGSAHVSVSLPKRTLDGRTTIWINNDDTFRMTAYDVDGQKKHDWHDTSALFELDEAYFMSAIYRSLTDKSPVPFSLEVATDPKELPKP